MNYKDRKVQCEIKVIYEHFDKTFECVQQLTIKELEDVLNDKEILVKCINDEFVDKIIKKLSENSIDYTKYYGTVKIYFDKYIIIMDNVIPTIINESIKGKPDLTPRVWMRGGNIIVTKNEFVKTNEYLIEMIVNIEEIHTNGYVHDIPNGVRYSINLKNYNSIL